MNPTNHGFTAKRMLCHAFAWLALFAVCPAGQTLAEESPENTGSSESSEYSEYSENSENSDSSENSDYSESSETAVAKIGETEYSTLAEAFAAAPADGTETTITMVGDYSFEGNSCVTVAAQQNVVFDLAGFTIAVTAPEASTSQLILNNGILTVKDSSAAGEGKITFTATQPDKKESPGYASNIISNNGTLTVASGTFENNSAGGACYAVDNYAGGTLAITGGTLKACASACRVYATSTTAASAATISGGEFVSTGAYAVILQQTSANPNIGKLSITGGMFSGPSYSLYAWVPANYNANGSSVEIAISGGEFDNWVGFGSALPHDKISITGGEIYGVYSWATGSGFVKGGEFEVKVGSGFIAAGYELGEYNELTGTYAVSQIDKVEVEISQTTAGTDETTYTVTSKHTKGTEVTTGESQTVSVAVDSEKDAADASLAKFDAAAVIGEALKAAGESSAQVTKIGLAVTAEKDKAASSDTKYVYDVSPKATWMTSAGGSGVSPLSNDALAEDASFTFKLDVPEGLELETKAQVVVTHASTKYGRETEILPVKKETIEGVTRGFVEITATHFSTWTIEGIQADSVAVVIDNSDKSIARQLTETTLFSGINDTTASQTVVLVKDFDFDESGSGLTLNNSDLTLDLNGHTLSSSKYAVVSLTGGKLTLTGDGKVSGSKTMLAVTGAGTELVLAGVAIEVTGDDAVSWKATNGKITIKDGTTNSIKAASSGCDGIYCAPASESKLTISGTGALTSHGGYCGLHSTKANVAVTAANLKLSGDTNGLQVDNNGSDGDKKGVAAGYYSNDVNTYCASGCMAIANSDETYKYKVVAKTVTLDKSNGHIDLNGTLAITATLAEEGSATWASSDTAVATVESTTGGATVTAVASGYAIITATAPNGSFATCFVTVGKVAKIGETEYDTLEAAFAAADESEEESVEITLVGNGGIYSNTGVTVSKGKTVTLDLAGYTISQIAPDATTSYLVLNNGTLTIKDSSEAKTGTLTCYAEQPDPKSIPGYATNLITNKGTLTIESGNYKVTTTVGYASYAVDNQSGGTLNINGGNLSVVADRSYVVRQYLNSTTESNIVNISGGTISGTYAYWMQFANGNANKATLNISGGTITATDGHAVYADNLNGTADASQVSVSLTGGTITSSKENCGVKLNSGVDYKSIEVSGSGTYSYFGVSSTTGNTGFITGGTFGNEVDEDLLANGYQLVKNEDDAGNVTYTLDYSEAEVVVAATDETTGETTYTTNRFEKFTAAWEKAHEEGTATVRMLANVSHTPTAKTDCLNVSKDQNITIDLNGYTITVVESLGSGGPGYNLINVAYGGTLTVKDSEWDAETLTGGAIIFGSTKLSGESYSYGSYLISNCGTVNVEGGMLKNNTYDFYVNESAIPAGVPYVIDTRINGGDSYVNVTGGKLCNPLTWAIRVTGGTTSTAHVKISGDAVICAVGAVWVQNTSQTVEQLAEVEISGGLIEHCVVRGNVVPNQFYQIEVETLGRNTAAKLKITEGAEVYGRIYVDTPYANNNWDRMEIVLDEEPVAAVEIAGGTLHGFVGSAVENLTVSGSEEAAALVITGGNFDAVTESEFAEYASHYKTRFGFDSYEDYVAALEDTVSTLASDDYHPVVELVENEDGTKSLVYTVDEGAAVAKIGSVYYTDLKDAFDAANAAEDATTITMVGDTSVTNVSYTVSAEKNITLDLNGCGIYGVYTNTVAASFTFLTNLGTLTVQDTSAAADGVLDFYYGAPADPNYGKGDYTVENNGTMYVKSGTISSSRGSLTHALYAIDQNSSGHNCYLYITGGTVANPGSHAIRQYALSGTYDNVIEISGGTVTGSRSIYLQVGSGAPKATLKVTGGNLDATGEGGGYCMSVYSYAYPGVTSRENISIDISGGTFGGGVILGGGSNKTDSEKMTVTGGTFTNADWNVGSYVKDSLTEDAINVSGGTYAGYVEAVYCAEGFVALQNDDGTYGVKEGYVVADISLPYQYVYYYDGKTYTDYDDYEFCVAKSATDAEVYAAFTNAVANLQPEYKGAWTYINVYTNVDLTVGEEAVTLPDLYLMCDLNDSTLTVGGDKNLAIGGYVRLYGGTIKAAENATGAAVTVNDGGTLLAAPYSGEEYALEIDGGSTAIGIQVNSGAALGVYSRAAISGATGIAVYGDGEAAVSIVGGVIKASGENAKPVAAYADTEGGTAPAGFIKGRWLDDDGNTVNNPALFGSDNSDGLETGFKFVGPDDDGLYAIELEKLTVKWMDEDAATEEEATTAILAVPVQAGGAESVKASELIDVASMALGGDDTLELKVYNKSTGRYYAWTYDQDEKAWKPDTIVTSDGTTVAVSPAADTVTLAPGQGVWVTSTKKDIPVKGVYEDADTTTSVTVEPGFNIVAPPPTKDEAQEGTYSLDTISPVNEKDIIQIPVDGGAPLDCYYDASASEGEAKWKHKEWYKDETTGRAKFRVIEAPKVKSGTGFWYKSTSSEDKALSL